MEVNKELLDKRYWRPSVLGEQTLAANRLDAAAFKRCGGNRGKGAVKGSQVGVENMSVSEPFGKASRTLKCCQIRSPFNLADEFGSDLHTEQVAAGV
jgi:hypothetical protein